MVFVTGGDRPAVRRDLAAIARGVPGAVVRTRAQDQQSADSQWVVGALMITVAVMAAFNAGATAAGERRAELLLARLCGATRGQVTRALTLEAVLTTLAGIAVGAAVVLISVSGAGHDPTGGPLVIPGQASLVVAAAAALGLAGSLLPAALTGHGRMGSVTELGD